MIDIINLTPHAIAMSDGTIFEPSGQVARVTVHQTDAGTIAGIPVKTQTFGEIVNLPEPKNNTVYIVSSIVLTAAKNAGRTDVVAPDTANAVRNDQGHIISVHGFVK